jgi:hypothetical protein
VHKSVVSLQSSMMLKLVIARAVNSAILLYLATPFLSKFDEAVLYQVSQLVSAVSACMLVYCIHYTATKY